MPARIRLVHAALEIEHYSRLEDIAAETGATVNDLAEQLLVAFVTTPQKSAEAVTPAAAPEAAPTPKPQKTKARAKADPVAPIGDHQVETARRLWASRFTTADIARLLKVSEASIEKALAT